MFTVLNHSKTQLFIMILRKALMNKKMGGKVCPKINRCRSRNKLLSRAAGYRTC